MVFLHASKQLLNKSASRPPPLQVVICNYGTTKSYTAFSWYCVSA